MQLMVWKFVIEGLFQNATWRHCKAIWGMAGWSGSVVGMANFTTMRMERLKQTAKCLA